MNVKKLQVILLAALLLACGTIFAQTQEKQKVAVYVDGKDAEEGVADFLGSKMVIAIIGTGNYTAVERTNDFLAQLNKSASYERSGAVDATSIADIGKQSNVDLVCAVIVKNVLNEKYVSARLIKVESAEVIKSADGSKSYTTVADLTTLAQEITKSLFSSSPKSTPAKTENTEYFICRGCSNTGGDLTVFPRDEVGTLSWDQSMEICERHGDDWVLPAKAELYQIYLKKENIGSFSKGYYWSSTEYNSKEAWNQYIDSGSQYSNRKVSKGHVRCVRRN